MAYRSFSLSLVLCVAALASSAHAQPYDRSIDCKRVESEGGNNYEMGQCAGRARLAAQGQLDQTVKRLQQVMPMGGSRKALSEAQIRWSAWASKEAALCASSLGYGPDGTGYGMAWTNCFASLTNQRIKVLQGYLREVQSR